jgi:ParB family chromosome partitioning protein
MNIQISKIRPNPNNPRCLLRQEMIDNLASSIAEIGLKNPIKLAILTPAERVEAPEFEYVVVDGMLRLMAAKKQGWTEIEAEVKDLDPKERFKESVIGNRGQGFFWLDLYIAIERLMADDPKLTQKQVGAMVEVTQSYVSCAIKALPLLNKSAREEIYRISINSADWEPSEAAVLALTKLAKGQPDDASRLEQALMVVLDRRMTEKQAKKLVSWVKKGNTPESFPQDGKLSGVKGAKQQNYDPEDEYADYLKELPKSIQVRNAAGGNSSISAKMDKSKALVFLFGGMSAVTELEGASNGDNKYAEALPELMEEARACGVPGAVCQGDGSEPETSPSTSSGLGTSDSAGALSLPEQKGDIKANAIHDIKTQLVGIIGQEPKSFTGKLIKEGGKLVIKGLKYIWKIGKKKFLNQ